MIMFGWRGLETPCSTGMLQVLNHLFSLKSFQVYPKHWQTNFPSIIMQWPASGVWLLWNLLMMRSYPSIISLTRPNWRYHLLTFETHDLLSVKLVLMLEIWNDYLSSCNCRNAQKISQRNVRDSLSLYLLYRSPSGSLRAQPLKFMRRRRWDLTCLMVLRCVAFTETLFNQNPSFLARSFFFKQFLARSCCKQKTGA